jgi:glycosyltransferase involved in cell wall biosynthesis
MKILFVAPWIPAPVRPRSLAFLEILSADHDVRFLALARHEEEARLADRLPVPERILVPNSVAGSMVRTFGALCSGRSLQTGYASPSGLTTALRRQLAEWRPDVVHLNVFRTAHLVEECGDTPVIIDLDEFRSEYYEQLAATATSPLWRTLGRIEQRRMRAREDELVRMGIPIIVSAPSEPGKERPNTYVVRSPCDFPPQHRAEPVAPTVLFVGRLTYEANLDGLMWFLRECWDGIRQAVPNAKLQIVGSDPPRSVQALAGADIEVHASVPDIEPYYAEAAVAIAPIFRGTGVQMKLIQALSAQVPTVTTGIVAERAGVADSVHVRIAEDGPGWISATVALLEDRAQAERLALAGRQWAVENHSSTAVSRQLEVAYAAVDGASATDPGRPRPAGPDRRDVAGPMSYIDRHG